MEINRQKQLDNILRGLPEGAKPTLLLQSCCGPCSSYVLEYLTEYFDVTLLFYNPNIRPEAEYNKRFENQIKLLSSAPFGREVKVMPVKWRGEEFEAATSGMESLPEGGARCRVCIALRLEETAKLAAENGFDYFCTTLSVSPHKNADMINELGQVLEEKYKVAWLTSDFKKRDGYKRSIELSAEYDLYRQNYCGCTPNGGEAL